MLDLSRNLSRTFKSNLCNFCTCCLDVQFAFRIDINNVLGNNRTIHTKKLANLRLAHPKRFALIANIQLKSLARSINQKPVARIHILDKVDGFICVIIHELA